MTPEQLDNFMESYYDDLLKEFGFTTPVVQVDRKFKLLFVLPLKLAMVRGIVDGITTDYVMDTCTHPSYVSCFEFGETAPFDAVVVALTLHFGVINNAKNIPV